MSLSPICRAIVRERDDGNYDVLAAFAFDWNDQRVTLAEFEAMVATQRVWWGEDAQIVDAPCGLWDVAPASMVTGEPSPDDELPF